MPNKLARREAITKRPPFDEETQQVVNAAFIYLVNDPFLNTELLRLAVMAAARQIGLKPERGEEMLANIMKYHAKAQGPLAGFM